MAKLPDEVLRAWEERDGPVILGTMSADGILNMIYAGSVGLFGEDRIVVADNKFEKTRQNILNGRKEGALLFRNKAGKAYQVKGTLEYHASGVVYEDMKKWNPPKLSGVGAAALRVEEVYSGAQKLL